MASSNTVFTFDPNNALVSKYLANPFLLAYLRATALIELVLTSLSESSISKPSCVDYYKYESSAPLFSSLNAAPFSKTRSLLVPTSMNMTLLPSALRYSSYSSPSYVSCDSLGFEAAFSPTAGGASIAGLGLSSGLLTGFLSSALLEAKTSTTSGSQTFLIFAIEMSDELT